MKIKKGRVLILLVLSLVLLAGSAGVYAEDFGMQITSNQTKVEPGQSINVKVGVKDLVR